MCKQSNKNLKFKRKIPLTRSSPDVSCFRKTTLFPINLPANRINTVPGVILALQYTFI